MSEKSYIGVNNVARKIDNGYIGINNVARKIKKIYVGVNGIAEQVYSSEQPFTQNIIPTSGWSANSAYTRATAANEYGTWTAVTDHGSQNSPLYNAFDDDRFTWANFDSDVDHKHYLDIYTPVLVCPSSVYIYYVWVDENSTIQGYNNSTSSWDDLVQLDYAGSEKVEKTFNISTSNFYDHFRLNVWWSASSSRRSSQIHKFRLSSGMYKSK